jgi:hypothetical protein
VAGEWKRARERSGSRGAVDSLGDAFARGVVLALAILLVTVGVARAVIIETGDGTGNTTAPPDDPGWDHVGTRSGTTVVYLGHRWVLTANHVGAGDVVIQGQTHPAVPGSTIRFENPDTTQADLIVFKIFVDPGLPELKIANFTPGLNKSLTLIGNGRDRGAATSWMGVDGYGWAGSRAMRWGTNQVADTLVTALDTQSFTTSFTDPAAPSATADEATAADGDSGGAVFIKLSGVWYLVGSIFAISGYEGQPVSTSLYGNKTYAAALSFYRDDILAAIRQPSCSDGLDDDGDSFVDYPDDPDCFSPTDRTEYTYESVPTLGVLGSALLVGFLLAFGVRAQNRLGVTPPG